MQIILYNPKTSHERHYSFFWIPYSLFSLASVLKHHGFSVLILDGNVTEIDTESLLNNVDITETLCVGISCMTGHQITDGLDFAKTIHRYKPSIPVVWGGTHPTLFPNQCLNNPEVQYVIRGYGEFAFLNLVVALLKRQDIGFIEGLCLKMQSGNFITKPATINNLNNIPDFKWDLIDLNKYVRDDSAISNRTVNYISSRGCPFSCGFCSEVALHKKVWKSFSSERTVRDVLTLTDLTNASGVKFYDANYFVDVKRVMQISQMLVDNKLKWAASAHPQRLLKLEKYNWKILEKSGCTRLLIGAESGMQEVLDFIHKQHNVQDTLVLAKKLRDSGIVGSFTFIVGFLDNVDIEVEKTLEMCKAVREIWKRHETKIHFYAPYPGTPLWNYAISKGFQPPTQLEEWANFNYYNVETGWVDPKYQKVVDESNKENCPYVHL
ncbi:MAG: hypothetical protein CL609_22880 [Anaerolineaceae bacterium]|nr:hypothetical protein [Anaerolineaceae bacterium]